MTVILKVNPKLAFTGREDFISKVRPNSIAVDGIIKNEQTFRVPEGPYANFDHHYGSDDIATRSSFMQVYLEIKQRDLVDRFSKDGEFSVYMYADHGDEDVCGCYWALRNAKKIIENENDRIRQLVDLCDKLDTTAGSFETGDTVLRRRMAWIFKPYHNARYKGRSDSMGPREYGNMIRAVNGRICDYVSGGGGEVKLEGGYEDIGIDRKRNEENGWIFTKEFSPASRMVMYLEGVRTFASLVGKRKDGNIDVMLGKKTGWNIDYCIPKIFDRLNKEEGDIVSETNFWGGSDMRGGSPKESGSRLSLGGIERCINEEVEIAREERISKEKEK
ncbi:hypothetical protein HN903_00740 [archaeon]|jgi:hypothetical protein|nr:hypothetical protein [archaeon]MBT7128258.1 hypothetical protein [archaeon]